MRIPLPEAARRQGRSPYFSYRETLQAETPRVYSLLPSVVV